MRTILCTNYSKWKKKNYPHTLYNIYVCLNIYENKIWRTFFWLIFSDNHRRIIPHYEREDKELWKILNNRWRHNRTNKGQAQKEKMKKKKTKNWNVIRAFVFHARCTQYDIFPFKFLFFFSTLIDVD